MAAGGGGAAVYERQQHAADVGREDGAFGVRFAGDCDHPDHDCAAGDGAGVDG